MKQLRFSFCIPTVYWVLNVCINNKKSSLLVLLCGIVIWLLYFIFISNESGILFEKKCSTKHNRWALKISEDYEKKLEKSIIYYNLNIVNKTISYRNETNILQLDDWTKVHTHVYIYSAYFVRCPESSLTDNCIKIIGIALFNFMKQNNVQINCFLKNKNNKITQSSVIYEELPDHHNACYRAYYFYCPVKSADKPLWVALLHNSSNKLLWKYVHLESSFKKKETENPSISLCVRPLFGPYKSLLSIGEFIAYYFSMGVSNFAFYKYSESQEVELFLKTLSNHFSISINLLPWNMPVDSFLIHELGQMAHIQDCVLRSSYYSSHVLLVDLDEYVVPQKHDNLKSMLKDFDKIYTDSIGYVIPMTLFCLEYEISHEFLAYYIPLQTAMYTLRQKSVWPHQLRSKVIVKPNAVTTTGIHFVYDHLINMTEIYIYETDAVVHHYRRCCGLKVPLFFSFVKVYSLNEKKLSDQRMYIFLDNLLENEVIKFLIYLSNLKIK